MISMNDNGDILRKQLIRGATGIAFSQVINRFLLLLLGVTLARGLGTDGYGVYSYAFALLTLLVVFAELGMPTLILREIAAYQSQEDWAHMRGILVRSIQVVILSSIIIAMIAALVLNQIDMWNSIAQSETLIWAVILLPFVALSKVIVAAVQGLQHVVRAQSVEMLVRPTLVLLCIGTIFYFYPDMRVPQYAMAIQLVIAVVILFLAGGLLRRYVPQQIQVTPTKYQTHQWLASAVPLTLIGGAGMVNSQTDILMLGFFRTPGEVGIYRVAVQGAALVAFGLQAANVVIAPQFARLYAQGDYDRLQRLVTKSARVILLAALPVAVTFILAGGVIAAWVFGKEFMQSQTPMAVLAAGQLVNAAMGSVGFLLNMTRHERDVARTLFITAGLNIILNFFFIPLYGMTGAAIATSISLVLWNILLYIIVKKRIGINSTAFHAAKGR